MAEKHPVSKLKRRKTSVEEYKSEQHHRTVPRESIGKVISPKDLQICCNRAADGPVGVRGSQAWWAQPSVPPLEKLWALTLQAFSVQIPEHSASEQLPDLPPPHTRTCARSKRAEWRWCCLGDEVGALPERPTVEQRASASFASTGQPVAVAPASAVPTSETTCPSHPGSPEPDRSRPGGNARTRSDASRQEEDNRDDDVAKKHGDGPVSVPTEVPQRCHQGGSKEQRGVAMATSRPAASSATVTADARAKVVRRESAAGTAATATAGVTLDAFFSAGRGAERGGRGRGGGGGVGGKKEAAIKQRPTDQRSGTLAPPTPSSEQQGASAGAGGAAGAGVRGLDCCPMCLMPFPAGFSQMDCDGHLAQCLSEMNTDMVW